MAGDGIAGMKSPYLNKDGNPTEGHIVISEEAMRALRKIQLDRLERNNKREERRKKHEEDVSDDEKDELAPFVLLGAAPGAPALKEPLRDEAPSSGLLFTDEQAALNSFRAQDDTFPEAIHGLAKAGITPPLTIFAPQALARLRSHNVKTTKHGTGTVARVVVIDVSEFPAESSLTFSQFLMVYNTFLTWIASVCGPKISQGFAEHCGAMYGDEDFEAWFPAYRLFDRTIRDRFFAKPFIIDITAPDYGQARQKAINAQFRPGPSVGTHAASYPSFFSTSDGGWNGPSEEPMGGHDHGSRFHPYARPAKKDLLCFRCGRLGHGAVTCSETEPSRPGRQFTIRASPEGLFRLSDDRAVCMRFNLGPGCSGDAVGGRHALHICSLCGDRHGAFACTRN